MRLIDGDAFRRELDNHWPFTKEEQSKHGIADLAKGILLTVLGQMPTIEPEQRWIPCKLGLPEDLEEVNVTWVNHKPEPYYEFVKDKPCTASAVYFRGDWYWYSSTCADILAEYGKNDIDKVDDAIEITAWKPIGEPWEGEQP